MNIVSVKDNKNNMVKKANTLIEAKGALSSTAQKILIMLISMLRADDTELQKYALNIKEFKKELGTENNEVKFYVEQAKELMRNPFEVDKKLFNWCSMVDYGHIEGYLIFDIHQDLKPYLLELQGNFTTYNIVNILSLRGDYTPRLYEYFLMRFNEYKAKYKKQHNKTPKSYTFELEIDWLRDFLKVTDGYRYNDIKRQIIEVAKKQFREKTNIKFDYKEDKLGRKVVRLVIKIENNNKGSNDYLIDLQSFIRFVRKNLINQDIWKGQGMVLSVDMNGKIYNKKSGKEYNKNDAQKVWNTWYNLAKEDKLLILKQGTLF